MERAVSRPEKSWENLAEKPAGAFLGRRPVFNNETCVSFLIIKKAAGELGSFCNNPNSPCLLESP